MITIRSHKSVAFIRGHTPNPWTSDRGLTNLRMQQPYIKNDDRTSDIYIYYYIYITIYITELCLCCVLCNATLLQDGNGVANLMLPEWTVCPWLGLLPVAATFALAQVFWQSTGFFFSLQINYIITIFRCRFRFGFDGKNPMSNKNLVFDEVHNMLALPRPGSDVWTHKSPFFW